mmetsp:Transcript_245/g.767  ORF Transcript_245/g.767 Transcript_245/m.767 type:complete len:212 (+) Transcript_245:221-856(+)
MIVLQPLRNRLRVLACRLPLPACHSTLESQPQQQQISPAEASELMFSPDSESKHQYVDVRTAKEFAKGWPKGAINIPYIVEGTTPAAYQGFPPLNPGALRREPNPFFMSEVVDQFPSRKSKLIIGSGQKGLDGKEDNRASEAAEFLQMMQYTEVKIMTGGFTAWAKEGLPTELDEDPDSEDAEPELVVKGVKPPKDRLVIKEFKDGSVLFE